MNLFIDHKRIADVFGWLANELRTRRRRLGGPSETRLLGSPRLYFSVQDALAWLRDHIRVPPAAEARTIESAVAHETI